jgi:hypothetical protein
VDAGFIDIAVRTIENDATSPETVEKLRVLLADLGADFS